MSGVYRSAAGQAALRTWCTDRVARWGTPHDQVEIATTAGPTHVLLAGAGPRTFVYLPGTNFNAATSLAVAGELARRGRLVLPDLPGQPGLSSADRPGGNRVAAYGRWAGEVIAWQRNSSADHQLVLVGHSLGAAAALAAPAHGVDGLVLLNPGGLVRARVPPGVLAVTVRWLARPSVRSARALAAVMSGPGHAPTETVTEWLALVGRHTRPSVAPAPLRPEATAQWASVPRLTVSGRNDRFFPPPALARRLAERFGDVPVVLDGVGHLSVDEEPRRVAGLVDGVLPPAGDAGS